jgi:RNA polymerase sigma-70 factor (ECF subfamily)
MPNSTLPISLQSSACKPASGAITAGSLADCGDPQVVACAQAGDHEAFTVLYSRHKRRVFSICLRMVRDFPLAEDLTQETFFQVHRKLGSFRGDSAFSTWLHRLAVNTVLMHLRKRGLSLTSLDQLMTEVPEERAGRGFGTVDLRQAGAIDRMAIERAVASLAPGYRAIFDLHDVQGFEHGEIATMLNCTRGNTKSQLHKARRALRRVLKPTTQKQVPAATGAALNLLRLTA